MKTLNKKLFPANSELKYEIIISGDLQTNMPWVFLTNNVLKGSRYNVDLIEDVGDDFDAYGINFYRTTSDPEGFFRMFGYGYNARPSVNDMKKAINKAFPDFPRKMWTVKNNSIYLGREEDVMLFMLSYGATKCLS